MYYDYDVQELSSWYESNHEKTNIYKSLEMKY